MKKLFILTLAAALCLSFLLLFGCVDPNLDADPETSAQNMTETAPDMDAMLTETLATPGWVSGRVEAVYGDGLYRISVNEHYHDIWGEVVYIKISADSYRVSSHVNIIINAVMRSESNDGLMILVGDAVEE